MSRPRVVSVVPVRPWARPGEAIGMRVTLRAPVAWRGGIRVELLDLLEPVASAERAIRLPVGTSVRSLDLELPRRGRRGYGVRAVLVGGDGDVLPRAAAEDAVEALEGWWESPRHACLTRFGPDDDPADAVARLAAWHVTVAQAYDWMYRHYRYLPPEGAVFVDPLGRRLSMATVRRAVAACHGAGIAPLAYGAVYGAEPEYAAAHPDEVLRDEAGVPLSLGGTFHIMDIRPGSPWRRRLLREYELACRRLGFGGIHMDTYGPPHEGIAADGERVRLDEVYPGLIAEADARVRATRPDRRVLFNCVDGWPLRAVAPSPMTVAYLELWPPDTDYADVTRWIADAREAAPARQVVIAAYLSALRDAGRDPAARAGAIEAALLLTAVIHAAGGFHHVLAEGDRLLTEGYYPAALPLRRAEAEALRAAWTFSARFVHLLSDPDAHEVPVDGLELCDADGTPVPVASLPRAGAVWLRATRLPDGRGVLQLVDLRPQADDRWDALRQPSPLATGWRLRWAALGATGVAMSPWSFRGRTIQPLAAPRGDGAGRVRLPAFRRWCVVTSQRRGSAPVSRDPVSHVPLSLRIGSSQGRYSTQETDRSTLAMLALGGR